MAHFAELDNNNFVTRVVVVHNNELLDNGQEKEEKGIAFLHSLFGHNRWKQTSYNKTIRKNYAGVGFYYDSVKDAFIPPQPYASWILDDQLCDWKPPIPYPQDTKFYFWDETKQDWVRPTNN